MREVHRRQQRLCQTFGEVSNEEPSTLDRLLKVRHKRESIGPPGKEGVA